MQNNSLTIKEVVDPDLYQTAVKRQAERAARQFQEILDAVPGKTIAEKARRCGVSRQTFYTWMNGSKPYSKQVSKLAKASGYSIAEIIGSTAAAR
jgi:DNA invertase Pin-like site-specific DNA recombinase